MKGVEVTVVVIWVTFMVLILIIMGGSGTKSMIYLVMNQICELMVAVVRKGKEVVAELMVAVVRKG
ncbi:hypothetical protein Hanom_Chr06g00478531 [Helianthus anomalus]